MNLIQRALYRTSYRLAVLIFTIATRRSSVTEKTIENDETDVGNLTLAVITARRMLHTAHETGVDCSDAHQMLEDLLHEVPDMTTALSMVVAMSDIVIPATTPEQISNIALAFNASK